LKGVSSLDDDGNIEMNEIEEEFEKTLRKRPAVRGEIKKTKLRAKLQKVAPVVFAENVAVTDNENEENEEVGSPKQQKD
jgi:hypothetical protein